MNINIKNCPDEAWNYEFIVCEGFEDGLVYFKHFKNAAAAEAHARTMSNPIIIHNVRVQGYRDPRPERCYTFGGTWSWSCWAHDKDEAIRKFEDEAYPEELCINPYDKIVTSEGEV